MSWRTVVVTGIAKLDYRLGFLVARKKESTARIHLSEIDILVIESTSISLTTSLLAEMIKHKIKVIFCDEKHNPSSELVSYYGSHDTSIKIKNQIAWQNNIKKSVGSVISYGSQTGLPIRQEERLFESSVISYGSQIMLFLAFATVA